MNARLKMTGALASLAVVTIVLRCLWLWQPERQLLLHQEHLLEAVEDRHWSKMEALIDPAYSDRWGHGRGSLMHLAREWLPQFFALTIRAGEITPRLTPEGGVVTERLALEGTGTAFAAAAVEAVHSMHTPCTFTWRHGSWRPWDWTLVRLDNPELDLTEPAY